jgi:hypothetical protein
VGGFITSTITTDSMRHFDPDSSTKGMLSGLGIG